ncbi:PI-PLC X domain-containing protein 1 [Acipenser oxyrinchus oxyrinchus]|uniref:PI-PLC X domain-containing protein 1 n=1 Tax=Acipenser oxyrinchus oxyrinchus TaxID=40147 RepID=A0AAD8G823_ACIOX|nr:PI-PLC X domain-containing protein 1 [Acipenser oxyrinchus oxyrinchus]
MSSVSSESASGGLLKSLQTDRWMSQLPDQLLDVPLYNLAIPGSHNSITYCLDKNNRSPVDHTQPDFLKKLDKYMKPIIRPFVYKWSITQESTVKEQLDEGVRYCDLRIAHKPKDDSCDLYFYHGVYTTITVEVVLKEIREWLEAHPKEVVILSFSHFLGLNQELHQHLIQSIQNTFGPKLCPKYETVTLRNLWRLGYQVIISYENDIMNFYDDLWPHISYWWANKCKAEALIQEIERRKQHGRPDGFFVAGINLTEDAKYIVSHPTESLNGLVMSTYPVLLEWVQKQTPGPGPGAINIIAGDFVKEGQLVPAVISLNEELLNWTS